MALKDIAGSLGVLPRLAVKEYEDRKQDKMEAEEQLRAQEKAAAEQAAAEGGMKKGGRVKGGKVKTSSASKRADGIATKGKTRGKMV
jgi:muconolactone delta-isomerase